MREYIKTGNVNKVMAIMSEGIDEASRILYKAIMHQDMDAWDRLQIMLSLDDMNIRGGQIVIMFNEYCHGNIDAFLELTKIRDRTLIKWLNDAYFMEQAVLKNAKRYGEPGFSPHPGIVYIINTSGQVLLQLVHSGYVVLADSQNRERRLFIQYLDDCYFEVDGAVWHMCEFADMLMEKGYTCNPTLEDPPMIKYGNVLYRVPRTKKELKQHKKMLAMYK